MIWDIREGSRRMWLLLKSEALEVGQKGRAMSWDEEAEDIEGNAFPAKGAASAKAWR